MPRLRSWQMFACILPLFLLLDLVWLGLVMHDFYSHELGAAARRSDGAIAPRWIAASLVYLLIPAGLLFFVRPRVADGTLWNAAAWGALYGLILYGVYDLTNRAILENWSLRMTIVDIAWGTTLCAILSLFMGFLDRRRPQ